MARRVLMKSIDTLVDDIYSVLSDGVDINEQEEIIEAFGVSMAALLRTRLDKNKEEYQSGLRLSKLGACETKQWLEQYGYESKEELQPNIRLKFLYGDVVEELLLTLVKLAGHTVEGQQDELVIEGISGHRDCVIDGYTVDVKSASSYGYKKFKDGSLKDGADNDPFGYMYQLGGYYEADETTNRDAAYFLAMDKSLGHLTALRVEASELPDAKARARKLNRLMEDDWMRPPRPYQAVPHNKSGNMKLDTVCSYCDRKAECWSTANDGIGIRTFLYKSGPVHLVHVAEGAEPNVTEVI